ncbi:uncharacterized protein JCM6883_003665 [Sporobolomyces salmoneus]|uniref:uncharacterized protein n=1 Tax=Sporobolomyces salmoneus TaxID=183962 RepID=UPI0031758AE8
MDLSAPPPPYATAPLDSKPSPSPLLRLPTHLLLQILSHVSLPTLVYSIKPVCRILHLAACTVTRSRPDIQQTWHKRIRGSSGIFSSSPIGSRSNQTEVTIETSGEEGVGLATRTREERVHDLYIASRARFERDRFESVLLLEGGEDAMDDDEEEGTRSFERDLFGFWQPKARCEDLVIERGKKDGWIEIPSPPATRADGSSSEGEVTGRLVREEDLKVELKLRSAKLLLPILGSGSRAVWKGVVEVDRLPNGTLEQVAYRLSSEFRRLSWKRINEGGNVSYSFELR